MALLNPGNNFETVFEIHQSRAVKRGRGEGNLCHFFVLFFKDLKLANVALPQTGIMFKSEVN